jgi:hypothetical protein
MSWVPQGHWEFLCYSHTRDVIGPVFQPDCRLVAVTLPQGGINEKKKLMSQIPNTRAEIIILKMFFEHFVGHLCDFLFSII